MIQRQGLPVLKICVRMTIAQNAVLPCRQLLQEKSVRIGGIYRSSGRRGCTAKRRNTHANGEMAAFGGLQLRSAVRPAYAV